MMETATNPITMTSHSEGFSCWEHQILLARNLTGGAIQNRAATKQYRLLSVAFSGVEGQTRMVGVTSPKGDFGNLMGIHFGMIGD
jgi:hypothetical protein